MPSFYLTAFSETPCYCKNILCLSNRSFFFCLFKALWCLKIRFKIGSLCSFLLCVYTTLVHPSSPSPSSQIFVFCFFYPWVIQRSVLSGITNKTNTLAWKWSDTRNGLKSEWKSSQWPKKSSERPSESLNNYCSRALYETTRTSGSLEENIKQWEVTRDFSRYSVDGPPVI